MRLVRRLALCVLAVAAQGVGTARANGRFPSASQMVVDPGDPSRFVLRATFGLVQSTDTGASWQWICEKSPGYGDYFDPAIGITKRNALLVGLIDGLSRSADRACGFARAGAPLDGKLVVDFAVDPTTPSRVVAVAGPPIGQTGNAIAAESLDDGATWTASAAPMPDDFVPQTIDVAPSQPKRLYASGNGAFAAFGVIVRSDDDGATWTSATFDLKGGRAPFIAAVDPVNADVLYVRVQNDTGDHLLVSKNAGVTWTDAFSFAGSMLGFALSPDGTRIAIGGPSDGVFVGAASDLAFTRQSGISVHCLKWTAAGLYACAAERSDGFTVGLSSDSGKTWKPLCHLGDITPLSCPAGTSTGDTCAAYWPPIEQQINPARDAGADAAGGSASDAGADGSVSPASQPPADHTRSCGCFSVGSRHGVPAGAAAAAIAVALGVVTRRMRRSAK